MKKFKLIIITFLTINFTIGQSHNKYSDELLSTSFKAYNEVDFEMAFHIYPFLKDRFLEQLKDSSSFFNPYDSSSIHIDIRFSSDSLVKTYAWNQRDSGCCYSTETYAQFRTASGGIEYQDLEELKKEEEEVFITDLQMIKIQNKPYYLILGWGTCCGGKHYSTANIYEVKNDSFIKSDSFFNSEADLYVGANRNQEIELKYSTEHKILSYNSYAFNEEIGFYKDIKTLVKWELTDKGFIRIQ